VEKTGRPALVIAREAEEAHGSGRSISAFHLLDALESCHDLFTRFGGHAHAVGFAMPSKDVPALKQRLNSYAQERLTPEDLMPELLIDAEIPLSSVTPDLLDSLGRLEPFGHGNREPVFSSCGVSLLMPPRILKEKHIKLRVNQKRPDARASYNYEAVGWRMAERAQAEALQPGDTLDVAYKIGLNFHPDFGGLELTLEDFRKSLPAAISICG
jgi:Single-stranded DNA-specific exonuclease